MINHGTQGGYYAHRRLKERPCDECRAAINEYVKDYRQKNGLSRNRAAEGHRRRALAALREKYRAEYEALVAQFRLIEEMEQDSL